MRRLIGASVVIAALAAPGRSIAAAGETLSLEDAVREAVKNNERGLKTPLRVKVAEGGLERARDAYFPTLVLGGNTSFGTSKTTGNLSLTLSQPILAPSAIPQYTAAKHTLYSERWGAEQDKRVLAFDAAKSFFQALATERLKQAAERRLATAKSNLDNAEARSAAGLTSSNDATRAQLAIASALSAVAGAQAQVEKAYLNLSFLTLRPVVKTLAPSESITKAALAYDPKQEDIKAAIDRRFDVKAAHDRTLSLEASAKEPLYRLLPTLGVSAALRLDPTPSAPKSLEAVVTLNATWTIFDAGVRYADKKARVAQADSAALDESALRRSVETDVKIAQASLKAARESFKIADEALAAAQKSVDETTTLYNQGLAKAIELTDANLTRFDADVIRASAQLTMEQAYLDLRQALGYGPLDA
ncbi:MAG: TolC family protein [Myxococcales bacterium]|nr:TolC family protein [Myxococcales bacterium]